MLEPGTQHRHALLSCSFVTEIRFIPTLNFVFVDAFFLSFRNTNQKELVSTGLAWFGPCKMDSAGVASTCPSDLIHIVARCFSQDLYHAFLPFLPLASFSDFLLPCQLWSPTLNLYTEICQTLISTHINKTWLSYSHRTRYLHVHVVLLYCNSDAKPFATLDRGPDHHVCIDISNITAWIFGLECSHAENRGVLTFGSFGSFGAWPSSASGYDQAFDCHLAHYHCFATMELAFRLRSGHFMSFTGGYRKTDPFGSCLDLEWRVLGDRDFADWRNAWNEEKAGYCCQKLGRGCAPLLALLG